MTCTKSETFFFKKKQQQPSIPLYKLRQTVAILRQKIDTTVRWNLTGSARAYCEVGNCSLVADEAQVQKAPESGRGPSLPDGEALAHDAVAVGDEHEGDEGGRLEEDPRHVRAERHPQRACLKVHARVPGAAAASRFSITR